MECEYGIGIKNRFARFLLRDESDTEENSKSQDGPIGKSGKEVSKAKPVTGKDAREANHGNVKGASEKQSTGKGPKSNKENDRGARAPSAPTRSRHGVREDTLDSKAKNNSNFGPGDAAKQNQVQGNEPFVRDKSGPFRRNERNMGYRNNYRNDNTPDRLATGDDFGDRTTSKQIRGGRGGQRSFRGPGREFDRRSGSDRSGVKSVDKKEGAGQRNWGSYKDDTEEPAGNEVISEIVLDMEAEDKSAPEDHEKSLKDSIQLEEEPVKLMTLDEYKALRTNQRQKPVFNVRKAGEGEDQSWMKKMTLVKKESIDEEEIEEDEDDGDEYPRKYGRQKQLVEINFRFADSGRGYGRGRGGRGVEHGRGGGQRGFRPQMAQDVAAADMGGDEDRNVGGERAERLDQVPTTRKSQIYSARARGGRDRDFRQSKPRVDDERDFPSLMG